MRVRESPCSYSCGVENKHQAINPSVSVGEEAEETRGGRGSTGLSRAPCQFDQPRPDAPQLPLLLLVSSPLQFEAFVRQD